MAHESYRWVAAVIAAHPNSRIVGRTRLQKTIRILQSLGLPTHYRYTTHFYGPYSEELQSAIGLLESLGLVKERREISIGSSPYFVLTATPDAALPDVGGCQKFINVMDQTDAVVLELAATYLAFREAGGSHADSLDRLRRKKRDKCGDGREAQALALLRQFRLPTAPARSWP